MYNCRMWELTVICILVKWPLFALSAEVALWRAPEKLLEDPDSLRLWHNPAAMLHCCIDQMMNAKSEIRCAVITD